MDLDRKRVHPSIFQATDRFTSTASWGGGAGFTPEQQRANAEHTRVWMAQNGKGCFGLVVFYAVTFFGTIALKPIIGKPMMGLAVGIYLIFAITSFYLLWRADRQRISSEELRALMPGLNLTPAQQAYTEAALALSSLNLPPETQNELWAQLNRLLDEEARLVSIRDRGVVGMSTPDSIVHERDDLRQRLEATTDPVSREALTRSLEICEGRLRASTDLSLVVQGVDAQLEMSAQSMRGMRDTLQRLVTAPAEHGLAIDLDPLRDTLERAHRHTTALEAAVSEVRTLA